MDNWTSLQTLRRLTTEEKQAIQENMANLLGIHTIMLSQKQGLLNDPNGFSTLMENGSCFTKISYLQPMG